MNLCSEIEEECAKADTSVVNTICEDMFKFSREKALARARLGLCNFSGFVENENIDKLTQFDQQTQIDLCSQINTKLHAAMNVKGPSFEAFTYRVFPTKKDLKKDHVVMYICSGRREYLTLRLEILFKSKVSNMLRNKARSELELWTSLL